MALLGSVRRTNDRLWPAYVEDLLSAPTRGCPAWTTVIGAARDDGMAGLY